MPRAIRAHRRVLAGILASGVLAGLAPAAAARQADESKITIAFKANENNLTPFTLTLLGIPSTHDVVHLVYDSLFWSQVKDDPEPWLAESAEPSADQRVWTVKLRNGLTWHDGQPLTAEDVAFTYMYMKDHPVGAGDRYSHHVWQHPVLQSADVVDRLTVRMTFKDPAPTFKILPGADMPIVPKHVWEKITDPAKATDMLPIGSGPYKMTSFTADQIYRLEANAAYFKGRPKVDKIDLTVVKDPSAAFAALQTGQVDAVDRAVPPELVDQMSNAPGLEVVTSTRMESVQLHFNQLKAPLGDARLRKGITMAIDNNALVQTVLMGHGQPGRDGWVHPSSPWADPNGGHEFNVAKANQTLDAAGYTRGDDGVRRTPDGKRLEFTLSAGSTEPQHARAAQLVAQQVGAVGVRMNVETVDPATLRQRRVSGAADAFITNIESHAHADPDALFFFFLSPAPGSAGGGFFGSYSNPTFDALVEKARLATDMQERKRLLVDAQHVFAQDAQTQVLFYPAGDYAYRTAAYDGWIADTGHGILTKRSFLRGYENADGRAAGSSGGSESGPPWAAIGVVLGLAVVGGGVLAARGRRREELEAEEA
jgi:peptide/nickel transport system substrate-binding protein